MRKPATWKVLEFQKCTWTARAFLLLIMKKATTAAKKATPPTTPAIIGIKFAESPGGGDGVDEGGGVVKVC